MNEHYQPMNILCQPCVINYDFIGVHSHLVEDSEVKFPRDVLSFIFFSNHLFELFHPLHSYISCCVAKFFLKIRMRKHSQQLNGTALTKHTFTVGLLVRSLYKKLIASLCSPVSLFLRSFFV